jgi:hypothetical protein
LEPLVADTLIVSRWPMTAVAVLAMVIVLLRRSPVSLPDLWREVAVVVSAYFFYFAGRSLVEGREVEATIRSFRLIDLEQALHVFWEPSIQDFTIASTFVQNFANWTYVYGHWPVVILAAVWLFFMRRDEYSIYRNAFMISGAIGLAVFTLFPLAPPRLTPGYGFIDTANAYHLGPSTSMLVNEYAAMPSLHFGWNMLVGIAIFRFADSIPAKAFAVVMPVAMFFAIVATGNHYIIDGVMGAFVALIGLFLAHVWHPTLQRWGSELRQLIAGPATEQRGA